jgi:hypothetical protein
VRGTTSLIGTASFGGTRRTPRHSNRFVNRQHNFGYVNAISAAGQNIPAARAANASYNTASPQLGKKLFKVGQ